MIRELLRGLEERITAVMMPAGVIASVFIIVVLQFDIDVPVEALGTAFTICCWALGWFLPDLLEPVLKRLFRFLRRR